MAIRSSLLPPAPHQLQVEVLRLTQQAEQVTRRRDQLDTELAEVDAGFPKQWRGFGEGLQVGIGLIGRGDPRARRI